MSNSDFNVLVLSDTHGNLIPIHQLLKSYNGVISAVIHLGDHSRDMLRCMSTNSELSYHIVNGNTDPLTSNLEDRVIELHEKRIFITHGHDYNVKVTLDRIIYKARELQVDACLFGHTHIPVSFMQNDILFFNPGSITYPAQGTERGYGMLRISEKITGKLLQYREPAWNTL
ncbi:MAG: metallophosphoesterase [Firmicutes bacterium]|nr:metallophosphoesterase [Bacillota bacterium]